MSMIANIIKTPIFQKKSMASEVIKDHIRSYFLYKFKSCLLAKTNLRFSILYNIHIYTKKIFV